MSWSQSRMARPLLTADEVRRLGRDEAIVVVSNQRPIWTKRWWWNREARAAPSHPLGPPKAAALAPPADPPREARATEQLHNGGHIERHPRPVLVGHGPRVARPAQRHPL